MAQIFVSHSSKDKESVDFLSRAFASTQVRAVFEEFDAIHKGPPNAERIANNIRQSNAVFLLLGKNVEELKHTRDWVGWESGVAAGVALETNMGIGADYRSAGTFRRYSPPTALRLLRSR